MDLKSLIKKDQEITVAYPDPEFEGLSITVAFASKEAMSAVRKECVTHTYNKKTRSMDETVDEDKFATAYVAAVVKGWTGFKYSYLAELLPIDLSKVKPEEQLPFTVDNAVMLMQNSTSFESVVGDMINDIKAFSKA